MTDKGTSFRPPVTVDIRPFRSGPVIAGISLAGAIGLTAIVSAFIGNMEGGNLSRAVAFTMGVLISLIAIVPLLKWRAMFLPRHLVLDADGMRLDERGATSWTVQWTDLAAVEFHSPTQDIRAPGWAPTIDLLLHPADPASFHAHPGLRRFARGKGQDVHCRVSLNRPYKVSGPIDRGLIDFAPAIYHRRPPGLPPVHHRP